MVGIIPLLNRSPNNYTELRYSLRGFEKWLYLDRVILVGGRPEWYTGEHIPFPDYHIVNKEKNIFDKLKAGAGMAKGPFFFCNDDQFILCPYLGRLNKGLLSEHIKRRGSGSYVKSMENTEAIFKGTLDYDVHYPLLMNWPGLEIINPDFFCLSYGVLVKTAYCNYNREDSETFDDHKTGHITMETFNRPFFSTSENVQGLELLSVIYPNKSKWER